MILYPNAKVNVGLTVGEKRSDGFHEIDSNFYPIPLFDVLQIEKAAAFSFKNTGFSINHEDNLVISAFKLMQKHYKIGNVMIELDKMIPLGAGLGGGSSDAAFCLKGLNQLFDLNLNTLILKGMALELGSDCPFFIENVPAHVSGRGEILSPSIVNLSGKYMKVVYPGIHISTEDAFANLIRKAQIDPETIDLSDLIRNDFENWAFKKYPELKVLKEMLLDEGAYFASMTGSGSAIYALYHEEPEKSTPYFFERIMFLDEI